MSDQIQRLREVAEAATEGPWEASLGWMNRDCPKGCDHPGHLEGPAVSSNAYMPVVDEWSVDAGDAEHIATFDPPRVLELLDRLERAEAAVERVLSLAAEWDDDTHGRHIYWGAAPRVVSAVNRTWGSQVHNHPPYRPLCRERLVDGVLRGACIDDDGGER